MYYPTKLPGSLSSYCQNLSLSRQLEIAFIILYGENQALCRRTVWVQVVAESAEVQHIHSWIPFLSALF